MPRIARIVLQDVAHHIVQRGNNREDVFFVEDDYRAYLRILAEQARAYHLEILAYCLMTNHVHLVAVPRRNDSLAKAIGRTDFLYTRLINRLHRRSGHLWQNRFYSCPLDELHLALAVRYVEQNPLRAGIVKEPAAYGWSSAAAHVGATEKDELLDLKKWKEFAEPNEWRAVLARWPRKPDVAQLRRCTARGWPLAGDALLGKLEKRLKRRLHPLQVGRPSGAKDRRPRSRRLANASATADNNR
jgi:putative transposase